LLRKNGLKVSNTGYFVYCNADKDQPGFTNTLQFKVSLLPYTGNDSWLENALFDIKDCLTSDHLPNAAATCEYCLYNNAIRNHLARYEKFLQ
jgi:hypothetical protein